MSVTPQRLYMSHDDNFGKCSTASETEMGTESYMRSAFNSPERKNTMRKLNDESMEVNSQEQSDSNKSKTSSIMIVFNTWNAMIGCGTVTIPWAFQQSGILLGVILCAIACAISFYTNLLLLRTAGKDTNYSDTMHRYFPKWGWALSMACFIMTFYVGIILFFQVLSQSLYPILLFATGNDSPIVMTTDWSQFSLSYTCLIILVICLLMTAPRDTAYVQKVNAFGVVFVTIFVIFIISNGIKAMTTTDYVYSMTEYNEIMAEKTAPFTTYIPLFGADYMPLMGILGGGFYFHNMSLTVVSKAEKPEHNTRNIFMGFFLVFITYSLIGVTGVYGFTGSAFSEYPVLMENCLNMFASDDKVATFIRACIFCQLLTVNTLLFGLLRSQILLLHAGITKGIDSLNAPGFKEIRLSRGKNFLVSFLMALPPIALAIWYPYVGKLGAVIAAFSTMFVCYILPLATFTKAVHIEQHEDQSNSDTDEDNNFQKVDSNVLSFKIKLQYDQESEKALITKKPNSEAKLTSWSFRTVAISSAILCSYGTAIFVIIVFQMF